MADARHIPLRDGSVHCVVSSPPYWALRDYGVAGQIGLERTPEEYVDTMVQVFREVKRVLRDDGTCWVNLGDSYAGSWSGNSLRPNGGDQREGGPGFQPLTDGRYAVRSGACGFGTKPKDLCGIPWRVAFALQADGWYLRSDIIWSKPNPMPESVTDRPTKAHEYLFLLSKRERYFYDGDAVREAHIDFARGANGKRVDSQDERPEPGVRTGTLNNMDRNGASREYNPAGRNRRTVWTIATQPYSGSHFATFPEKLVEPCILAGTSARGCCDQCGQPWVRVVESARILEPGRVTLGLGMTHDRTQRNIINGGPEESSGLHHQKLTTTTGWRPTCEHSTSPIPCTVLDPFVGSGTTVRVARRLGREGIGLDISAKYLSQFASIRTNHRLQQEMPW